MLRDAPFGFCGRLRRPVGAVFPALGRIPRPQYLSGFGPAIPWLGWQLVRLRVPGNHSVPVTVPASIGCRPFLLIKRLPDAGRASLSLARRASRGRQRFAALSDSAVEWPVSWASREAASVCAALVTAGTASASAKASAYKSRGAGRSGFVHVPHGPVRLQAGVMARVAISRFDKSVRLYGSACHSRLAAHRNWAYCLPSSKRAGFSPAGGRYCRVASIPLRLLNDTRPRVLPAASMMVPAAFPGWSLLIPCPRHVVRL